MGEIQLIGKYLAVIQLPITIGVFQTNDSRKWRTTGPSGTLGIIAVFGHEQAALLIEGDPYRVEHQRLGGHQFDFQSRLNLQAGEGFCR